MINIYADFAQNFMAMPVVIGLKSKKERFAGAEKLVAYSLNARWKGITSWHFLFRSEFCKSIRC